MGILSKISNHIRNLSVLLNVLSAASLTAMMLLTFSDVVLRLFRHPIPGTYELVGFLGAIVISFSLAHTSLEKGHIAVGFLVDKLSARAQRIVDRVNALICTGLFSLISFQSVVYALDTKRAGEVSMTLQLPVYPFILGIAIGCGILCIVLMLRFFLSFTIDEKSVS